MRLLHSLGRTWEEDQAQILAQHKIMVQPGVFSYIHIGTELFEKIANVALRDPTVHSFGAAFDKADLMSASWVALIGLAAFGYPQPQLDFEVGMVYDVSARCATCGLNRGRQRNPFRIKSESTKLLAFQLEWINDELFVNREIYNEIFAPLGIGYWPVLIHRSGKESDVFVQLDLPEINWKFDTADMRTEVCAECGRSKYVVRPLDFLPHLGGPAPNQVFRGQEFYGSGAHAFKRIYFSQELFQTLLNLKIARWQQFYPLES